VRAPPGYTVEQVAEALDGLSPSEKVELFELLAQMTNVPWVALPGPQSEACYSEADITGYGGAAGGGKTDLAGGLALTEHQRSIIYRREAAQLTAIVDRLEEILGTRQGFNGSNGVWRLPGRRQIEFGGFPNLGDERRFQGRAHDLKVFDEVTEMLEAQVRFLMGWLRSSKKGVRQRILMTFNPPTTPEGRWVLKFFGPWLDKRHPMYPTAPGELRWCTTINGEDVWLPDGRPFVFRDSTLAKPRGTGERVYDFDPAAYRGRLAVLVIHPMSRTFIPARVTDNPYYMASDYLAKLQALPEPLRSQMLNGDFEAGMEDHEWQVIPTEWVRASMERWKARGSMSPAFRPPGQMDSMGVDVAMGGKDKCVIARRHGRWFADLIRWPGKSITSGAVGAGKVIQARRDRAPVHVDVVGWGSDTYGALQGNNVQSVAINGANGTNWRTKAGQPVVNKRAELIWKLREALDPDGEDPIDLPDDVQLELDLTAYRWKPTRSGILIRSKEEMKVELGRSPDDGDAVAMALEETPKEEVVIDVIEHLAQSAGGDYDRMAI
jgi:hypothetical protein